MGALMGATRRRPSTSEEPPAAAEASGRPPAAATASLSHPASLPQQQALQHQQQPLIPAARTTRFSDPASASVRSPAAASRTSDASLLAVSLPSPAGTSSPPPALPPMGLRRNSSSLLEQNSSVSSTNLAPSGNSSSSLSPSGVFRGPGSQLGSRPNGLRGKVSTLALFHAATGLGQQGGSPAKSSRAESGTIASDTSPLLAYGTPKRTMPQSNGHPGGDLHVRLKLHVITFNMADLTPTRCA